MNSAHHLILASNSPRRKELLRQAGYRFQTVVFAFEEVIPGNISIDEAARYLAEEKNKFYRTQLENQVIITADTTVVLGDRIFNKASDRDEALHMIMSLSDQTHEVISGVCVSSLKKTTSFLDITAVTFGKITQEEASYYVDEYQPFDKAGAYGIQEWIGLNKIISIQGSYFNVVGLPVHKLYHVLKDEFGINPMH